MSRKIKWWRITASRLFFAMELYTLFSAPLLLYLSLKLIFPFVDSSDLAKYPFILFAVVLAILLFNEMAYFKEVYGPMREVDEKRIERLEAESERRKVARRAKRNKRRTDRLTKRLEKYKAG